MSYQVHEKYSSMIQISFLGMYIANLVPRSYVSVPLKSTTWLPQYPCESHERCDIPQGFPPFLAISSYRPKGMCFVISLPACSKLGLRRVDNNLCLIKLILMRRFYKQNADLMSQNVKLISLRSVFQGTLSDQPP